VDAALPRCGIPAFEGMTGFISFQASGISFQVPTLPPRSGAGAGPFALRSLTPGMPRCWRSSQFPLSVPLILSPSGGGIGRIP